MRKLHFEDEEENIGYKLQERRESKTEVFKCGDGMVDREGGVRCKTGHLPGHADKWIALEELRGV